MERRAFIAMTLATVGRPLAGRAQQKAKPVVGFLSVFSPPTNPGDIGRGPVLQGLRQTGFVEGQSMSIERRWAEGHYDRLPAMVADLVSRKVDLIVTFGGTPPAVAAKSATSTITIVFTGLANPVGKGLVASLARPGGNITGFSNFTGELTPKRLELLCELVPQATVIALLANPDNTPDNAGEQFVRFRQAAARVKGVQLPVLKARTEDEIDTAFASLGQLRAGGLVVESDAFYISRREQLLALASRYAVPVIYENRGFAAAGGLISYGIDDAALGRQAGIYAGRILKGEKPADLPVQQPTKFELVVNLKTVKALGLTAPPLILARADEVIE